MSSPSNPQGENDGNDGNLQMIQVIRLLVNEVQALKAANKRIDEERDKEEKIRKEDEERLRKELKVERDELKEHIHKLENQLKQNAKDMKSTEKRSGIPEGQALSVEERDQLDFFLQSPGIGMIFLSVAFAVSGEDASGGLQDVMRTEESQIAASFPDAKEELASIKGELTGELTQDIELVEVEMMKLNQLKVGLKKVIDEVIEEAELHLDILMSTIQSQVQAKWKSFRDVVLKAILAELHEADLHEGSIPKKTDENADNKKRIKSFLETGAQKFQTMLTKSISSALEKTIGEKEFIPPAASYLAEMDGNTNFDDQEIMKNVEPLISTMMETLGAHRLELQDVVFRRISEEPLVSASTSKIDFTKSLKQADEACQKGLDKLFREVSDEALNAFIKQDESPEAQAIRLVQLRKMLKLQPEIFSIGDLAAHQMISHEIDILGSKLKTQLEPLVVKKLKDGGFKDLRDWWHLHLQLKIKSDQEVKFTNAGGGGPREKAGNDTNQMNVLKNIVTVLLFFFVLLVQFAYLFFVFYELYQVYTAGFCPGYSGGRREDPPYGADSKIRTLMGFVGAYFVMKNGSKLFKYLKALEGNNGASSYLELLKFAKLDVFLNCPVTHQVEAILKSCYSTMISDAAKLISSAKKGKGSTDRTEHQKIPLPDSAALKADYIFTASETLNNGSDHHETVMGYGKGMGFGGLAEQNKPNKTEPGKTPNKDTKMLVADTSNWKVQEVVKSRLYYVFCLDVFVNFSLVALVMLNNLYIVFVSGATAQDVLQKIVILDFILAQQENIKRELFSGASGKAVLRSIRAAFEWGLAEPKKDVGSGSNPKPRKQPGESKTANEQIQETKLSNEKVRRSFEIALHAVGIPVLLIAVVFVIYGPLCKPGVADLAAVNMTFSKSMR